MMMTPAPVHLAGKAELAHADGVGLVILIMGLREVVWVNFGGWKPTSSAE
jgi:hypothetical protein